MTRRPVDLVERVSHLSSNGLNPKGQYDLVKTPDAVEKGHRAGALRDGPPPTYTSPEVLALFGQYICVGLMMGVLNNITYPMFTAYFHLEGTRLNSAKALMNLAWSFKVFIGMMSDCLPLWGMRRKPYMLLGWLINSVCMIILACKHFGDPLYIDRSLDGRPLSNLTADELTRVNVLAPDQGNFVVLLCTIATFGHTISDVCADALVVEYAQREPESHRGRIQSLIYAVRLGAQAASGLVLGICVNSPNFGGSFSWDIGVNGIFIMLAVASCLVMPITYFFVHEEKRAAVSVVDYLTQFWALAQKRAVWQVMIYLFWSTLLSGFITMTAADYVKLYWAKVESFNSALMSTLGNIILAAVLMLMGSYGTQWNWCTAIVLTTLVSNGLDAIVQYMTIYDVFRNQWFYLGVPLAEQLPIGINWAVGMYVIVELAEDGNEGIIYGLLTTVINLPEIFGAMITNMYCANFKIKSTDIATDASDVRRDVAICYAIIYATRAISCFLVQIFPNQKAACAELKQHGGSYPRVGALVLISTFLILGGALTSIIMSMFDATACYVFAGGSGCDTSSSN
ncbi:Aste57867_11576 [Aphanomyces stellatus]|uniref:Aste57867_11576 protein n=1 Tax=Aphanomyces stellatus TaxID=120398 RepID=A0A485KTE9_9STRA|nr:hypothetical protein As57867_011533 [Aphanomyces stellatus]VFT88435.1 Aste57867_11576 [Aphanomyces stellatus]